MIKLIEKKIDNIRFRVIMNENAVNNFSKLAKLLSEDSKDASEMITIDDVDLADVIRAFAKSNTIEDVNKNLNDAWCKEYVIKFLKTQKNKAIVKTIRNRVITTLHQVLNEERKGLIGLSRTGNRDINDEINLLLNYANEKEDFAELSKEQQVSYLLQTIVDDTNPQP